MNKNTKLINDLGRLGKNIKPDPAWKKQTKASIVQFASNNQSPGPSSVFVFKRHAFSYGMALLLILTSTTLVSANQSNPGETLYPLKRFIEGKKLMLASDEKQVELKREYVIKRLDELDIAVEEKNEIKQNIAIEETEKSIKDVIESTSEIQRKSTIDEIKKEIYKIEAKVDEPAIKVRIQELQQALVPVEKEVDLPIEPSSTPTPVLEDMPTLTPEVDGVTTSSARLKSNIQQLVSPM